MSPILSSGRYRYYVLFLDNFTNFVWIFPRRIRMMGYDDMILN